ncbi:MAG: DNA polymerase I [Planctomycetes bacterium]|nr:DNA polymerase I [Planctomycetota bacterium]
MNRPKRLFVFDGSALAYRSHFAFLKNPLINSAGVDTSATFGFTRDLLRVLDEEQPELAAVVFDVSKRTFRHDRFPEYKATRQRMPEELAAALGTLDRIVDAFNLPRLGIEGYEGDDLMATLARMGTEAGLEVYLVTGDKDFCQVVSEQVKVYNPWRSRGTQPMVMTPADVLAKYDVPPERFRDYLALVGDASDNVPGVPGIGPKRAAELLNAFGSLDALLERSAEVTRPALREALEAHREQALLSRELVAFDEHAPLDVELEELERAEPDRAALVELFAELEFKEFLRRFSLSVDTDPHVHHRVDADGLDALIEDLRAAGSFVFDLETTSLRPEEAEIVGMAFAYSRGEAYYVPAVESTSTGGAFELFSFKLDFAPLLERLRPLLEDPSVEKGGQNVKYDTLVLAHHGVHVQGVTFDTLLESYLIDPAARTHGLDDLALRYLGYKKIATREVMGTGRGKRTMDKLRDEEILPYASEDADITLRLHQQFSRRMAEQPRLQELYRDVELPLMKLLGKMERRGIRVDTQALAELGVELRERIAQLSKEIYELAGEAINLSSPKQVGGLLFDRLKLHEVAGLKAKRTATGAYSTDAETLETLREHHPLVGKLLEHRGLEKLLGTYVDALPGLIGAKTGRVHTSFNQAVAATGRLSSSDPNLQNIPVRTAEGKRIRAAFVAGAEDWVLVAADYSQVELRILAHYSQDDALLEAFRADKDVHAATAASVFGVPFEEVTPELRGRAKAINFGIAYGMGAQRLARDTALSLEEARAFIENYFARFPGIKGYLEAQVQFARKFGYVETLLGRRRPLPDIRATRRLARSNAERMAINTPIQGSAADIIKIAMVRIDRRLAEADLDAHMLLQVHDELVFECPAAQREALVTLVREEMQSAFPLAVPLKVDVGYGRTWLQAH